MYAKAHKSVFHVIFIRWFFQQNNVDSSCIISMTEDIVAILFKRSFPPCIMHYVW